MSQQPYNSSIIQITQTHTHTHTHTNTHWKAYIFICTASGVSILKPSVAVNSNLIFQYILEDQFHFFSAC